MLKMNCKVGDVISISDDLFLEVIDTSKSHVTLRINGLDRVDLTVTLPNLDTNHNTIERRKLVA